MEQITASSAAPANRCLRFVAAVVVLYAATCGGTPAAKPDAAADAQATVDLPVDVPIDRTPACPMRIPESGDGCIAVAQACDFGAYSCRCNGDHQWECYEDGQNCPTTRPQNRSDCAVGPACYYDQGLRCVCQWGIWQCDDDKRPCPATVPAEGSTCDAVPLDTCRYNDWVCGCLNNVWRCGHPDPRCPPTRPSSDCVDANLVCRYGAKGLCLCSFDDGLWLCTNS